MLFPARPPYGHNIHRPICLLLHPGWFYVVYRDVKNSSRRSSVLGAGGSRSHATRVGFLAMRGANCVDDFELSGDDLVADRLMALHQGPLHESRSVNRST